MKAVIIEDEKKSREMLADLLKSNFPQITILGLGKNVAEGVELIQNLKPNLLFLDISMPDGTGFDVLEKVQGAKFDIIFTNIPASPAGLYVDMVEIASIEKSLLVEVNNKINRVKQHLKEQFNQEFPKAKKDLELYLEDSFLKILSNQTKSEKKYQFHLLKVFSIMS